MNLIITIIVSLALGIVALKRRDLAVVGILFLLPTYVVRFDIVGIPLTMLESCILIVSAVWIVQEGITRLQKTRSSHEFTSTLTSRIIIYLTILLVLAAAASLLITPDLRAGLGIFKAYIIEPILFYFLFIRTIRTRVQLRTVLWALSLSATAIAIIAIVQYATGWGIPEPWNAFPDRRSTGIYGFPNAVGLYIAPILTMWIGICIHGRQLLNFSRLTNALSLVMLVLMAVALIAARVEGAVVAVIVATGVLLLSSSTRWRWWAMGAGVVGGVAVFSIEFTRRILLFQDVSGDVRLALWKGTWNLLQHQPIFGAGLAGFPMTYDLYRLPSHIELLQYAHNLFLDFWTQLGIGGLLWISAIVILWFTASLKLIKRKEYFGSILLSILVSILVYGLVDVPYFKNDLSVLFWTWLAILIVVQRLNTSRVQ